MRAIVSLMRTLIFEGSCDLHGYGRGGANGERKSGNGGDT
jgi:hypothetical protein